MKKQAGPAGTVDEYIKSFPQNIRKILEKIRGTIRSAAPSAVEKISYRMPTYWLNGNLVHFAGCAKHIGFYPTPSAITAFQKELSPYETSKGAVQFPIVRPMPLGLIRKMVAFRVRENRKKAG
ncbi:MAG: DUF1801 domain-containing protein [Spirochaetes bacterium]|nr:DUF1801 domain-containing protein [Candidatus Atribacteria bacterium]MCX7040683.1 DUF1801 domain-containing protein [Spirochaetota bacterium]